MNHDQQEDLDRALASALTSALRRVNAPPALLTKFHLLAAEAQAAQQRTGSRWQRLSNGGRVFVLPRSRLELSPLWLTGAIAAMLAVGVFGAESLHLRHEHQQQARLAEQRAAQQATAQFELATRITDRALAHTRAQLLHAGVDLGD